MLESFSCVIELRCHSQQEICHMVEVKRVLLVDDDPNIRKLAKMSLERVGHWQVAVASSGAEALQILSVEQPDLVILDVMMPGLDGRTTLAQIKSGPATAHVPVILMTAKVQGDEMDTYLSIGAAGVIIKPFDPMSLPKDILALLVKAD
jgi:two-component system OmpR family response regulator